MFYFLGLYILVFSWALLIGFILIFSVKRALFELNYFIDDGTNLHVTFISVHIQISSLLQSLFVTVCL